MCPSTSCPLSSLTRNIVFGRASVISPSISIFSSLAMRLAAYLTGWRDRPRLTALERRLARPFREERFDRALQVLGREEAAGYRRLSLCRLVAPAPEGAPYQPLGRGVGLGRPGRELLREPHPLLEQLVV